MCSPSVMQLRWSRSFVLPPLRPIACCGFAAHGPQSVVALRWTPQDPSQPNRLETSASQCYTRDRTGHCTPQPSQFRTLFASRAAALPVEHAAGRSERCSGRTGDGTASRIRILSSQIRFREQ
jgi:hypothetical protein